MSPRVQTRIDQKRLRTPRIPSLLFQCELVSKALTKMIFIFDQSFFIALPGNAVDLFRIAFFRKAGI
jgi:hypothetical protein